MHLLLALCLTCSVQKCVPLLELWAASLRVCVQEGLPALRTRLRPMNGAPQTTPAKSPCTAT